MYLDTAKIISAGQNVETSPETISFIIYAAGGPQRTPNAIREMKGKLCKKLCDKVIIIIFGAKSFELLLLP